jgi:signal transduction histidine kinase
MSAYRTVAVVGVAVAGAAACEWVADAALPAAAGDAAAGAALLGAGALALSVSRGVRSGALMVVCGVAWLAGTLWTPLLFVHRGPLAQLVLAYPRALPRPWFAGAVVVAAYVCGTDASLARDFTLTLLLAAAVVAAAALRHQRAQGAERRARAAGLAAALLLAVGLAAPAAARAASLDHDVAALWLYDATVVLIAVGLAADLRWGRWTRAAVADLVSDLGSLRAVDAVRDRLARALGDPALTLSIGEPPTPPPHGRTVTIVDEGGQPVGALVYDPTVAGDPQLLDAAVSVARLAADNARLERDVALAMDEVAASRRRLVEAGLEQRRRVEADLRGGAEQRLADVARRLDEIAANAGECGQLAELGASLERARDDLHRFAQGVHPCALTEEGLPVALRDLADSTSLPVRLVLRASGATADVEASAYFLCAEALANITKHANATAVEIGVRENEGALDVTVHDDGIGAADPAGGTGLRGLADRIAALGGSFEVQSPPGAGTWIHARIPL